MAGGVPLYQGVGHLKRGRQYHKGMRFGRLMRVMVFPSLTQLVDSDNSTPFLWVSAHRLLPHRVSQPPTDERPVTLPLSWLSHTRTRGCGRLSTPLSGTRHMAQV